VERAGAMPGRPAKGKSELGPGPAGRTPSPAPSDGFSSRLFLEAAYPPPMWSYPLWPTWARPARRRLRRTGLEARHGHDDGPARWLWAAPFSVSRCLTSRPSVEHVPCTGLATGRLILLILAESCGLVVAHLQRGGSTSSEHRRRAVTVPAPGQPPATPRPRQARALSRLIQPDPTSRWAEPHNRGRPRRPVGNRHAPNCVQPMRPAAIGARRSRFLLATERHT